MTILERILGRFGAKAITVPPLDGAFRPNRRLDEASIAAQIDTPLDLAAFEGTLIVASNNAVHRLEGDGGLSVHSVYPAPISAIAAGSDGRIAVGLETGVLLLDANAISLPPAVRSITALAFGADGMLYLANGSRTNAPSRWKRDLLTKQASGSIWRIEPDGPRQLASGLAWPQGIAFADDKLIVSESWRRRLVRIDIESGDAEPVLSNIPGYPGRLSPLKAGGFMLAVFAPVNRLIEFVLQEDAYLKDMLADIDPEFWIAPALFSGRSFLEPLQCGGIKTMGIHKPWAPSLSYGLVARLNSAFQPIESYHSRSDGRRHGIFGAVEQNDRLYAISAGGDLLLQLDPGAQA